MIWTRYDEHLMILFLYSQYVGCAAICNGISRILDRIGRIRLFGILVDPVHVLVLQ